MSDDKPIELDAKTLRFFCSEFRKFIDGIETMAQECEQREEENLEEIEDEEVLSFSM